MATKVPTKAARKSSRPRTLRLSKETLRELAPSRGDDVKGGVVAKDATLRTMADGCNVTAACNRSVGC